VRISRAAGAAAIIVGVAISSGAAANTADRAAMLRAAIRAESTKRPAEPAAQRLAGSLRDVARSASAAGERAALQLAEARGLDVAGRRVRVVIEAAGASSPEAAAAVSAAGGAIESEYGRLVQAVVPPDRLRELALREGVRLVRSPYRAEPAAVAGEGVAATNTAAWHTAGLRGAGVKVAIVDLGFGGYPAAQANGDLPPSLVTLDLCSGHLADPAENHGTAVAEIVHEMAPAAQLYLICVGTEVEFAQAVSYAKQQGVAVINFSVGFPSAGRGDGQAEAGMPESVVADARANGILWVNSAGNHADSHWSGVFNDSSGLGIHTYVGSDPDNDTTIPPGEVLCAWLKWDDWPRSSQDYDLFLFDAEPNILSASTNVQNGAQPPEEFACYENESSAAQQIYVVIAKKSATATPRLDLYTTTALQHQVPEGSIVVPATSPAAVAVGALCWQTEALEFYSSLGPTIDGRTKPDFAAPSRVSTMTYGPGNCSSTFGFAGTSASAPHIAGAAALLKGRNPTLGASGLAAALEQHSTDLGVPGKDNSFGTGKLQLLAAAPTGATGVVGAIGALSARVTGTANPKGGASYYFDYGPTTSYGSKTAAQSVDGIFDLAVAGTLTGLAPATTYHYRLVLTSPFGTFAGADRTLTTAHGAAPAAVTGGSSAIGTSSATVSGKAQNETESYLFEYGPTAAYGLQTPSQSLGATVDEQQVAATLTGLSPGTTYHYRLVTSNRFGRGEGADATFTTHSPPPAGGGGAGGGGASGVADLSVSGTVSPPAAGVGDSLVWRLRVDDKSLALIFGVHVDVDVPQGLSLGLAQSDRGSGCAAIGDARIRCNLDFLAPSAPQGNIVLATTITTAGEFLLRATAGFAGIDPTPADNTLTLRATTIGAPPAAPARAARGVVRTGTQRGDRLTGTPLADVLRGRGGNDKLDGRSGNDSLDGGPGRDTLIGGLGNDRLNGGAGDDVLLARDNGRDTLACGGGRDRVVADARDRIASDCENVIRG
jgi:hypothetical protein